MAQSVHLIGLMSGSSLDGLDIAWVEFSGAAPNLSWKLHAGSTVPLTSELKSTFQNVNVLSGLHLAELDAHFCKWMGGEVLSFIKKQGCNIDYVASHGHTLYHQPSNRYTVQLGNGGYLAAKTGIDTISDFRTTDVASGGQGAPFAPIADLHLFSKYPVSMNLGVLQISRAYQEIRPLPTMCVLVIKYSIIWQAHWALLMMKMVN